MNDISYLKLTVWGVIVLETLGSMLVLRWWKLLPRSGRLAGGWLLAATLFGWGGHFGKVFLRNSLIVTYFWFPVSAILAFNALASMHGPGRSRVGLRILSWLVVIAWAVLGILVETPGDYSRLTSPMHAVLLAAAGAYTLITRVEASRTDLLRDSSFVISAFWVIYAIPTVFLSVAARYFFNTIGDSRLLVNFYSFRNTIVFLVYPILLFGIWLSTAHGRSAHSLPEPRAAT